MIKRFYRYLPFLSSYAFRLAALLESLRRMYSVSPQIFVIFCLNCLFATWYYFSGLLVPSRTRYADISLADT